MVAGDGSSGTLTRDPEVLWATHQGRGLSWREGQGHGSPVAAFFFFKSRRMRRDRTPHTVDTPWSTHRGRRCLSSLSGRPRLSACRVVLFEHEWCGARTVRGAAPVWRQSEPSHSNFCVENCRSVPTCHGSTGPQSCSRALPVLGGADLGPL